MKSQFYYHEMESRFSIRCRLLRAESNYFYIHKRFSRFNLNILCRPNYLYSWEPSWFVYWIFYILLRCVRNQQNTRKIHLGCARHRHTIENDKKIIRLFTKKSLFYIKTSQIHHAKLQAKNILRTKSTIRIA